MFRIFLAAKILSSLNFSILGKEKSFQSFTILISSISEQQLSSAFTLVQIKLSFAFSLSHNPSKPKFYNNLLLHLVSLEIIQLMKQNIKKIFKFLKLTDMVIIFILKNLINFQNSLKIL